MWDWYTWDNLRKDVGEEMGECISGTIDSATSNYIADMSLADFDADERMFDRAWLLLVDADERTTIDEVRVRVTTEAVMAYDPTMGRLYFNRALNAIPDPGDLYEIHSLIRPTVLDELMDRALRRVTFIYEGQVTLTDDTYSYELNPSVFGTIGQPSQVVGVFYDYEPETGETQRIPVSWWDVSSALPGVVGGYPQCFLHVHPQDIADTLTVQVIRNFARGQWSWPTAGTYIPAEWAKAAIEYEAYRYLASHEPAQDAERYDTLANRAAARYMSFARVDAPRAGFRVRLPDRVIT